MTPRILLRSYYIGGENYYASGSVKELLMDMHLRAPSDEARKLIADTIEQLRAAEGRT